MERAILFVSPHTNKYGAEKSMIALISYFKEKGIRSVVVIPNHGVIEDELKKQGAFVIVNKYYFWINENNKIKNYLKFYINYLVALKLKKILIKYDFDILAVHSNSIITPFGCQISKVLGVKHVQHIREFGTLDFNMKFNFSWKFMARLVNKSTNIICISDAVSEYFEQYFDRNKLITIYNGVKVTEFFGHKENNKSFNMLIVGRLSQEKGQLEVIKALELVIKERKNCNIKLDLYGNGNDEELLRKFINDHHLEKNVFLKGYSSSIDYSQYSVAILSSLNEAFGRVTIEYMLHELPVIGANTGGTKELVQDGITGLTYTPGDINSLKKCIEYLLMNKDVARSYGIEGRKRAVKDFSEIVYCNNVWKLYQENVF